MVTCGFWFDFGVMSGGSGGSEKNQILTLSSLAACLLESMESEPIDSQMILDRTREVFRMKVQSFQKNVVCSY